MYKKHTATRMYMLILRRNKIDIYMNKVKSLFYICIAAVGMQNINAQTRAEVEIRENPKLTTGKYMAYEAPSTPLTQAPEGYVPCYISTYARHGSRYLTGKDKYEPALTIMENALKENGLTADGEKNTENSQTTGQSRRKQIWRADTKRRTPTSGTRKKNV